MKSDSHEKPETVEPTATTRHNANQQWSETCLIETFSNGKCSVLRCVCIAIIHAPSHMWLTKWYQKNETKKKKKKRFQLVLGVSRARCRAVVVEYDNNDIVAKRFQCVRLIDTIALTHAWQNSPWHNQKKIVAWMWQKSFHTWSILFAQNILFAPTRRSPALFRLSKVQ